MSFQFTDTTLPTITAGTTYSYQFTTSGGVSPVIFSSTDLPPSATLTPAGLFTYPVPTTSTASIPAFTLTATDASNNVITEMIDITFANTAVPITVTHTAGAWLVGPNEVRVSSLASAMALGSNLFQANPTTPIVIKFCSDIYTISAI